MMTDETLEEYIKKFIPQGSKKFQVCEIDGYSFTFMVVDDKTIGVVLDMSGEPHIYVMPEHRGKSHGFSLLKGYFKENDLLSGNKYVFYNAGTEDGLNLIKRLHSMEYSTYKVIEVADRKFIILKDSRIKI